MKIIGFTNAMPFPSSYAETIQTRPYRAPEAILGMSYSPATDVWSLGCMVFEILTGDLLFTPRQGIIHTKNEDHLALVT